ncbi:Cathepsin B endopeptidase [Fasciola gigantica]|uniref:Cathepsin B-like cysteine proteinase n=1 Tax=Fasciola gigantica TaxID=46835 RepID=A0A504YYD7_FASGI|nr:Cathepsin B endopeptidase [Fasciola gigantica]
MANCRCRLGDMIRDQSSCYSCWAFGAVEAMSDRVCIHSNGRMRPRLSALDPLSCCNYCGYGCLGGFPSMAWDFWWRNGIVTGGSVEQQFGCLPYPFPRCGHGDHSRGLTPCPADLYPTPQCSKYCRSGYVKTYEKDKFYGNSSYNVNATEGDIMMEIMKNGPVEATYHVYDDFISYKSGIYHHVIGEYYGMHAVRVLGWGVENGVKYWLAANSWNELWGEYGFFRIRRGNNECGIESMVNADNAEHFEHQLRELAETPQRRNSPRSATRHHVTRMLSDDSLNTF